jgi:NAD(P)H-dependent flavin oxidoreductase YrpB (nitropropane dioxygenase family)
VKTRVTSMLGIELPIFAFSHCRDVVVEVSRAGGMGVLGVAGFSAEQLERELSWIDAHVDGRPYGVDLLIPGRYETVAERKLELDRLLPAGHRAFVHQLCDAAGLPPLPQGDAEALLREEARHINMTPEEGHALIELALQHSGVKLVVNALGTPPKDKVEELHARGIKVGSLVGKPEHARAQLEAGVDVLIAQGMEAGGHTGQITSMVLWPQIVDLAAPVPVLAAGGIGRGRQMAAALALGADGIWCGSIWLGTRESELDPLLKERLFAAPADDAVQTRALTGKPCRALKSRYTEAWERAGAPPTLPMPLQSLLGGELRLRATRGAAKDWMSWPVGQIVGDMKYETSVRQVVQGMLEEFADAVGRLNGLLGDE